MVLDLMLNSNLNGIRLFSNSLDLSGNFNRNFSEHLLDIQFALIGNVGVA